MTLRRCLTPIVLLALWGCESRGLEPGTDAALALQIGTAANFVSAADAGTVHIEGPTSRSLSIQPGETRTVEGLEPGQYNVALEALLAGRLESFGETSVTVTPGRVSQANITLRSFIPSFLDVEAEASRGSPFDVQFGAVSGAEGYLVEWDDDASFASPESADASGTSTSITFSEQGTHYVRVIARGPYGNDGIPTEAATVDVVNQAPTATILQPVANATFALGEEVTFEGSAEDPEDGTLTGASLAWTSDVDGDLGTGTSLVVSDLSAGPHTITLTATDSNDAAGTDTRSITVEAGEPTVRIGETPSSTAAVGDQVILPIVLDLDQTGGAYEVAVLEIVVGLSNVLFGAETWTVANGDFVFTDLERSTEGTTQFGRIGFSRDADFAQSATVGLLILDAAAVGTASVEVEIVTASDPDGEPIGAGLFTEVPHELAIEEGQPTVQLLEPGGSQADLDGGVLYFRIPVGTVPGTVPGGPVYVEPSSAPGGRGRVHGTSQPAGAAAAGSRGPFEGSASLGELGAASGYARLLRGLLSDRDTGVQEASGSAPGQTLRVQISGGTGDADLYVRYGQLPTPNTFDCRPFLDGNNEGCDAVDAPDGDWFVMIRPFGPAFAGVFLEAFLFEPVSIVTASLPGGAVGTPYQATLQAAEGDGTYSWSLVAGDLPPNVELSEDGILSGTPTAAGDFTFTVQVVSAGKAAQAEFTVTVVTSAVPLAYVFAREPTEAAYAPTAADGVNLSGGPIQITREGTGAYTVTFAGLGIGAVGTSFTALVNTVATGPNPELVQADPACRMSLVNAAVPLRVQVDCEDPATGAAADARYRVLVVGNGVLPGNAGFSLHHATGSMMDYAPNPSFSWNSNGAPQLVSPQGGGVFRHTTGISVSEPYTVAVSTIDFQNRAGSGIHSCNFSQAPSTFVDVVCRSRSGAAADKRHTMLVLDQGRPGTSWAYTFINGGVAEDVTRTSGGGVAAVKQGVGRWRLTFDGINLQSTPGITATPFTGPSWAYCSHFRVGSEPLVVDIACYDGTGTFADVPVTVLVLR